MKGIRAMDIKGIRDVIQLNFEWRPGRCTYRYAAN